MPFHLNTITSTQPLEYLYTHVWTSPVTSIDHFKYYLVIVDHFTRYTWLYPLKQKSQVKEVFIAFKALVENRFQTRVRTLYSDNGGEFIALRSYLAVHGISHLTTPPHTPEHNGIAERKHRHIVETGLTLLTHASVPKSYWPYAFATAVYLINRMPTEVINGVSPYAKLFKQSPNYLKLRVFGCVCFPWLRPYRANKLQERSTPCVFVGYSLTQSAYLCLEIQSGRLYTSRHVQFIETSFPFSSLVLPSSTVVAESPTSPGQPPVTFVPTQIAHSSLPPCSVFTLRRQLNHHQCHPITHHRRCRQSLRRHHHTARRRRLHLRHNSHLLQIQNGPHSTRAQQHQLQAQTKAQVNLPLQTKAQSTQAQIQISHQLKHVPPHTTTRPHHKLQPPVNHLLHQSFQTYLHHYKMTIP